MQIHTKFNNHYTKGTANDKCLIKKHVHPTHNKMSNIFEMNKKKISVFAYQTNDYLFLAVLKHFECFLYLSFIITKFTQVVACHQVTQDL